MTDALISLWLALGTVTLLVGLRGAWRVVRKERGQ